ncbi:MAG: hypothetical protein L6R39_007631 [Caloplaca ligustica]|nr:MAG: hypothetical protein L6R39_007631 [Caloplaca ligustica]
MAEVAVCEGVRAVFEPDDDGVDLADGADERVVDVVVDGVGGDEEAEGCVDAVGPGYGVPGCLESAGYLKGVWCGKGVGAFEAADDSFGMLCGAEFDDVGDEQVAWDKRVEEGAEDDVLTAIVVAANADEDTILGSVRKTEGKAWNPS